MDERDGLARPELLEQHSPRLVVQVSKVRMNPYVRLLSEALSRAGVSCSVLEGLSPGLVQPWLGRADVLHLHWPELLYASSRLVRSLRRLAAVLLALSRVRARGCRLAYTVHNLSSHDGRFPVLDSIAQRTLFRISDAVHVHDQGTASMLARHHGRHQGVYVIPHGSYVGVYPNESTRAEARTHLGLPADAFVYLFLGQIRRYKGLEGLLDAFWQSSDDVSWLVIAGNVHDAEYADELQQMADGRPRLLTWLRYVPDGEVQMFMNACDICVLPYREVTTSGAAVLSFSFGRPIVAPSLGSFGEMAGDGRGILYDPDDGEGLAQALARARSGDLAVAGRRALAWAEEHTWSALAPAFLRMYSDALASR